MKRIVAKIVLILALSFGLLFIWLSLIHYSGDSPYLARAAIKSDFYGQRIGFDGGGNRGSIIPNVMPASIACEQGAIVRDSFGAGGLDGDWNLIRFGNANLGYGAQLSGGRLMLNNSGSSNFQTDDNAGGELFFYRSEPLPTEAGFELEVQLIDVELLGTFSKAGLGIRSSFQSISPKLLWGVARNNGATTNPRQLLQPVARTGGVTSWLGGNAFWETNHQVDLSDNPIWLRLERPAGDDGLFYFYYRQDSGSPPLDPVGRAAWWGSPAYSATVSGLGQQVYVGLYNVPYIAGQSGTSVFDDFSLAPNPNPCRVEIDGPTSGLINNVIGFGATLQAITGTGLVTYSWQATDYGPYTNVVSGANSEIDLAWGSAGLKEIAVTAQFVGEILTATHTIAIEAELCSQPIVNQSFEQSPTSWVTAFAEGVTRAAGQANSGSFKLRAPSFNFSSTNPWFYQQFRMPDWIIPDATTLELSLSRNIDNLGNDQGDDQFYALLTTDASSISAALANRVTTPTIVAAGIGSGGPTYWESTTVSLPTIDESSLTALAGQDVRLYFYDNNNSQMACTGGCKSIFYFDDIDLTICSMGVAPAPQLAISKTGPAWAAAGDLVTYTLSVTNSGSMTATQLVITDAIPAGANHTSGGDKQGDLVRWNIPFLGAGDTLQVSFGVTAPHSLVNLGYGVRANGDYSASGQQAVTTAIGLVLPVGGGLVEPAPGVVFAAGNGTFAEDIILVYTPQPVMPTGSLHHVGLFYDVQAISLSTGLPVQPQPGSFYSISLSYDQQDVPAGLDETELALYSWNGTDWIREPSSSVDSDNNIVTATPGHLSMWAALAPAIVGDEQLFLPLILK